MDEAEILVQKVAVANASSFQDFFNTLQRILQKKGCLHCAKIAAKV